MEPSNVLTSHVTYTIFLNIGESLCSSQTSPPTLHVRSFQKANKFVDLQYDVPQVPLHYFHPSMNQSRRLRRNGEDHATESL